MPSCIHYAYVHKHSLDFIFQVVKLPLNGIASYWTQVGRAKFFAPMMNNLVSSGGAIQGNFTMTTSMNSGMISDDLSEPSSPESSFDASDLLGSNSINDEVTAQLASSGTTDLTTENTML